MTGKPLHEQPRPKITRTVQVDNALTVDFTCATPEMAAAYATLLREYMPAIHELFGDQVDAAPRVFSVDLA
jgi:hypothetical protein